MESRLQIDFDEIDQKIILRLSGRLDAVSSPLVEKKINYLLNEGHKKFLLDFGDVNYMSSAGLRLLLSMTKKIGAEKGLFAIFSLTEQVHDIIKLAGFDRILKICKDEAEALNLKV